MTLEDPSFESGPWAPARVQVWGAQLVPLCLCWKGLEEATGLRIKLKIVALHAGGVKAQKSFFSHKHPLTQASKPEPSDVAAGWQVPLQWPQESRTTEHVSPLAFAAGLRRV